MKTNNNSARSGILTRRRFNRQVAMTGAGLILNRPPVSNAGKLVPLALVKNPNRSAAISIVIESLGEVDCQGKDVYLKGNFNSADPYPASTHPAALSTIVQIVREKDCNKIILIERSGMGRTREVWQKLGISELAKKLDLTLLPLESLPASEWRWEKLPGSHWKRGIEVPSFLREGIFLIQICNLKTHRFGGQFSASLKNSIGLMAKQAQANPPYNYMAELHSSPDQRLMIAEVNQIYRPSLVVMDAGLAFVDGGPESGDIVSLDLTAASRDRVAIDVVGLALLRLHGAKPPLGRMPVFEQEQIRRAVELELGVGSGEEIRFITRDPASGKLALQLKALLSQAPEEERKKS